MYFLKSKKLPFDRKYISDAYYITNRKYTKRNNSSGNIYNMNHHNINNNYNYHIYNIQYPKFMFKTKKLMLFNLLNAFIILIILKPLISKMNLIIDLEISEKNAFVPILNLKNIEYPQNILLNNQIADQSLINRENNYLNFKCLSSLCKIKLVWSYEINNGVGDNNVNEPEQEKIKEHESEKDKNQIDENEQEPDKQQNIERIESGKNNDEAERNNDVERESNLEPKPIRELEQKKNKELWEIEESQIMKDSTKKHEFAENMIEEKESEIEQTNTFKQEQEFTVNLIEEKESEIEQAITFKQEQENEFEEQLLEETDKKEEKSDKQEKEKEQEQGQEILDSINGDEMFKDCTTIKKITFSDAKCIKSKLYIF